MVEITNMEKIKIIQEKKGSLNIYIPVDKKYAFN
jgi:hypothetical protein